MVLHAHPIRITRTGNEARLLVKCRKCEHEQEIDLDHDAPFPCACGHWIRVEHRGVLWGEVSCR